MYQVHKMKELEKSCTSDLDKNHFKNKRDTEFDMKCENLKLQQYLLEPGSKLL